MNNNQQQLSLLDQPERTVAFTGYRPHKLPQGCNSIVQRELSELLTEHIKECYTRGYRIFINGCMSGWDILAAEAVLRLRISCPELYSVTVAPFRKGFFANSNWTPEWAKRARIVYCYSNQAFSLSEMYQKGIYYTRDRFLVDHASLLLAYYDGKPGGTRYTIDYAEQKRLEIINLSQYYRQWNNL